MTRLRQRLILITVTAQPWPGHHLQTKGDSMSYQHINKQVWSKITQNLSSTQSNWLMDIIHLHNRGNWKVPVRLSSNCVVSIGKGVVYIRRSEFNCHAETVSRIVKALIIKGRLTPILSSNSSKYGGMLLYINDFASLESKMSLEFFETETNINALYKIEIIEGEYDKSIKWCENRLPAKMLPVPPLTPSENVASQANGLPAEKSVSAYCDGGNENSTPSGKSGVSQDQLNNGPIIRLGPSTNEYNNMLKWLDTHMKKLDPVKEEQGEYI